MTDRELEPLPTDFDGVEIRSEALDMGNAEPRARPPHRLTLKQLGIAFCLAVAGGATFALWTKPVPAPPADAPPASARAASATAQTRPEAGRTFDPAKPDRAAPQVRAMSLRKAPPGPVHPAEPDRPPGPGTLAAGSTPPRAQPSRLNISHTDSPAPTPAIAQQALAAEAQDDDRDDGPSFDCRYASSSSERMVCEDPSLALADRVLGQSYERAIASGVPRDVLSAGHARWLATRESAAHDSRKAVADAYARRIDELRTMADERTE